MRRASQTVARRARWLASCHCDAAVHNDALRHFGTWLHFDLDVCLVDAAVAGKVRRADSDIRAGAAAG
eukprot:8909997-Lingulodinium_polyedra.AAC.1